MATSPALPLLFSTTTTTISDNQGHTHLIHLLNQPTTTLPHLKQIHAQTLRTVDLDTTHPRALFLHSKILHHSSHINLTYAARVFHHFPNPNSFMWNTLIRAHARSTNHKRNAIQLYKAMITTTEQNRTTSPDNHTFPFVLKACAYTFSLCEGKQVHAHVLKHGFASDTQVCNSLVHFYATCGCLDLAEKIFHKMRNERNEVSWNVMIDSYAKGGEFSTALKMFGDMQKVHEPDGYTMQSVISACAGLGALSLGLWVHAYILKKCDKMVDDVLVNTCLVDMYCKCGELEIANQVFESMPCKDVNSWNSMILGFAMHGKARAALDCYVRMVKVEKIVPNSITFVGVLSACNHSGMVDEGMVCFDMMTKQYNVEPRLEHYGCVVDLLARAGRIHEALKFVSEMPIKPDAVIWRSLLDACCKQHACVELSEEMAKHVFESEGSVCGDGVYVLLSKVYASACMWNDVGLLRKLMSDKGVAKEPGCSLIEIDGVVHGFFAGDTTHPQSENIYKFVNAIEEKLESTGYVPDYSGAPLVNEANDEKQNTLRLHSERLAIAFGILNSRPGVPIRVFKNLRVCNDCHRVTKLISRIYNAEIIVRDRARFHHFKDGTCSCMDYW